MATEIKMPQLSDTMDAGKILSWKKKEGENVGRGEILAEVETDKANLEIECFTPGTLLKLVAPVGHKAKVGEVIAIIGQPGESVSPSQPKVEQPRPAVSQQASATPGPQPSEHPEAAVRRDEPAQEPAGHEDTGGRVRASPLARKIARERSIDLGSMRGSGPGGRIVSKDIEGRQPSSLQTPPAAPRAPRPQAIGGNGGTMTELSSMRQTIARRMQETVAQSPHFYTTVSIDMEPVARLREKLKEQEDYKGLSINHFVIKAAGYALEREPSVNCAMRDGKLYTPPSINIGIITATPEGLLIPVIRDTNGLSLRDLAFEVKAAVERAKAGRPNALDLSGGTFSISNMGMFDVENFTALINPGQGAVLAVSSAREEPVVKDGVVVPGVRMKVTLSVDHRVIDGVMAARWLTAFREGLENPALLFI